MHIILFYMSCSFPDLAQSYPSLRIHINWHPSAEYPAYQEHKYPAIKNTKLKKKAWCRRGQTLLHCVSKLNKLCKISYAELSLDMGMCTEVCSLKIISNHTEIVNCMCNLIGSWVSHHYYSRWVCDEMNIWIGRLNKADCPPQWEWASSNPAWPKWNKSLSKNLLFLPDSLGSCSAGVSGKECTCQCRRCKRPGFDPWVEKIPWRRTWKATPVFLPGESHGLRSLEGYSP